MGNYIKTFRLKKTIILTLIMLSIYALSLITYADEAITININNNIVEKQILMRIEDGRVFVPIRIIAEEMGSEIVYDNNTKTVTIKRQDKVVKLSNTRNINGYVMLSIREVAELLECEVRWEKTNRTIYIYTKDIIPKSTKRTDNWGRRIQLSSFPTEAQYFPYICEDVPNWVYEGIIDYMKNANKRALWSGYEIDQYGNSATKWSINKRNTPNDFWNSGYTTEVYYTRLKKYLDFCLNIDYRVLKHSDVKKMMSECIGENQFRNFDKAVDSWYKYYLRNKIIISGESTIMPEGFHLTDNNLPVLTAYIKFNISSQTPNNYRLIGNKDNNDVFQTNNTYEGLIVFPTTSYQGDANNYKLDYDFLGIDIRDLRRVD